MKHYLTLRFAPSSRDNSPVSFIAKTDNGLLCVKESEHCNKAIAIVPTELKDNIIPGVKYDCEVVDMKGGARGYVVTAISPVQYIPTVQRIHVKKCIYQLVIKWYNQYILFDPKDGRQDSVNNYNSIASYLLTRIDIEDVCGFTEQFKKDAASLVALMEAEMCEAK